MTYVLLQKMWARKREKNMNEQDTYPRIQLVQLVFVNVALQGTRAPLWNFVHGYWSDESARLLWKSVASMVRAPRRQEPTERGKCCLQGGEPNFPVQTLATI
eukprot:6491841-Amphidinium_carterae.2